VDWEVRENDKMAIDAISHYFVVNMLDAANFLTDDEFETVQGLIKKVEILSKRNDEYVVIPKKQCPTLFSSIKELIDKGNGDKNARHTDIRSNKIQK